MKIKTIKYEEKCPDCGSTSVRYFAHNDGFVSSEQCQCGNCGKWYTISMTYDEDSSYGQTLSKFQSACSNIDKLLKADSLTKDHSKKLEETNND